MKAGIALLPGLLVATVLVFGCAGDLGLDQKEFACPAAGQSTCREGCACVHDEGAWGWGKCVCGVEPLRATPPGSGPVVRFDLDAKPWPDVPLPNNALTRAAPGEPTGRRLDFDPTAVTDAESRFRLRLNDLDGFGTFGALTVSFSAPLDLASIRDHHALNRDLADDLVYLVNVDRASPGFGEVVLLDAGQGNFPLAVERPWLYLDNDVHADSPNLVLATHDEDRNGNGVLDPYEDVDFDGVLDRPNTWDGKDPGPGNIDPLIPFYEMRTDTLILRPVVPLRAATTYAVVLTDRLADPEGRPVRSPFPEVHAEDQRFDLAPLKDLLAESRFGSLGVGHVAFAWSFTTQSITPEIEAIRRGLYGSGPLASLAADYPLAFEPRVVADPGEGGMPAAQPYVIPGDRVTTLISAMGPLLGWGPAEAEAAQEDAAFTDYWVQGSFPSPGFLVDADGIATSLYPSDDDEVFRVRPGTGEMSVAPVSVSVLCAIPKAQALSSPPFPVVQYVRASSEGPFEMMAFAGRLNRARLAVCSLDGPGVGFGLPADDSVDWRSLLGQLMAQMGLGAFGEGLFQSRVRDLDNDGQRTSFDSGGDFWGLDGFHTRDLVRQAVVDHLQFTRLLRGLGTAKWKADTNGDGQPDLMGDFNGDGVPDLGTSSQPDVRVWGRSRGALTAGILAAVEPAVSASVASSGGGGLVDVALRSTASGVAESFLLPMMGPFLSFTPGADGTVEVAWILNDLARSYPRVQAGYKVEPGRPDYYPVATTSQIAPGDTVVVRNETKGLSVRAFRGADGKGFRVALPCDAVGAVKKRALLGLKDGDTLPVPVGCAPGTWTVRSDDPASPEYGTMCDAPDSDRASMFGDRIAVEVYSGWVEDPSSPSAAARRKARMDTFERPVTFQGAVFPAGTPLVAIGAGLGLDRNQPAFRRMLEAQGWAMARGDPVSYAAHLSTADRLDACYDTALCPGGTPVRSQSNLLVVHAVGDQDMPVAAGLALARAAGILGFQGGGTSDNDRLLQAFVPEGIEGLRRHSSSTLTFLDWKEDRDKSSGGVGIVDRSWPTQFDAEAAATPDGALPLNADPDRTSGGKDGFGAPAVAGYVPATVQNGRGIQALRLPYLRPLGSGLAPSSDPKRLYNVGNHVLNQVIVFLASKGAFLSDDACLADSSCAFLSEYFASGH